MKMVQCHTIFCARETRQKILSRGYKTFLIENIVSRFIDKEINSTKPYPIPLDQVLTILFTSGSTGEPKAVAHTFGNHYYSALGSNQNIPVKPFDRWLLSLPLYHVSGLSILFRCFLEGGTIVIPQQKEDLAQTIAFFRVTHVSCVTTQVYQLLKQRKLSQKLKSLKVMLVGGGPIPKLLITTCTRKKLPIHVTYGLTEMSSQVATSNRLTIKDHRPKTKVLKYRHIKISQGNEILVKGQTLFKGYVVKRKIIPTLDKKGWFHTGDLGGLKSGRYLTVTGRKDSMFISGGENIQPEEIEQQLLRISGIEKALVVSHKDKQFDYRPVAFIKTKVRRALSSRKLTKLLERHLPRFKIPIKFYRWPSYLDTKDKINRKVLEKLL